MKLVNDLPMGEFTISVIGDGRKDYKETNLFTTHGLQSVYKSGKHTIIDSAGGIFKHCRVGSGVDTLTYSSTGVSSPIAITSTLTKSKLNYFNHKGIDYAQGVFKYRFDGDHVGTIRQIMLTEVPQSIGMLCGKTLDHPIPVVSGDVIEITYVVNIPIIQPDTLLVSGNNEGEPITIHGGLFETLPNELVTTIPFDSERVTSGAISRGYIDGIIVPDGGGAWVCSVQHTANNIIIDVSSELDVIPNSYLQTVKFGNKSTTNVTIGEMNFTCRYGTRVLVPSDKKWKVSFKIEMVVQ